MKTILVLAAFLVAFTTNAQEFTADVSQSEVTWTGKKVTGQHHGSVNLKSGKLIVNGNTISGGEFVIDMTSIKVLDIEPGETNSNLEGHLKSDDFFGVETHPESKLVITEGAAFNGNKATVEANLTIKGITKPISFEVSKENNNTYSTMLTIDRSDYDVRYGSGSFFDNLGDNLIYDDFEMGVKLVVE